MVNISLEINYQRNLRNLNSINQELNKVICEYHGRLWMAAQIRIIDFNEGTDNKNKSINPKL